MLSTSVLYFVSIFFFVVGWEAVVFCLAFRDWTRELLVKSRLFRIARIGSITSLTLSCILVTFLLVTLPYKSSIPPFLLFLLWLFTLVSFGKFVQHLLTLSKAEVQNRHLMGWFAAFTSAFLLIIVHLFFVHYP